MKTLISLIILFVTVGTSCNKTDIAKGTPQCVKKKIEDFNKTSSCDDAKVKEYEFQGGNAFLFEPGTCGADMTSEVIDSGCITLGYLGGITGNTKINGEEFSNAKFLKTIWKK